MRLTSDLWVSAFIRREAASGAFCTLLKKGNSEAGAIFIVHLGREKTTVYGPAPQAHFEDHHPSERLFEIVLDDADQERITEYFERQAKFDPDFFVVETETPEIIPSIEVVAQDSKEPDDFFRKR